ncbi:MAG: hypothetical protein WAT39_17845 [Planctomycetota bacterium]
MIRWFVGVLFAAALAGQAVSAPKTDAELDAQVIQALVGFARNAENWKAPSRARAVYEQILDHYDTDNGTARAGLGWKRVKDEWQVATPPDKLPKDAATPAQQKQVEDAWRLASKRVATLHRTLGLALDAEGHRARAVHHFERALVFDPDDLDCHKALGHEELDGFFGSPEQLAFVQRMRAIFAKAREIAEQSVEFEPVATASLPDELRKTGIAFSGARSKHVTYWHVGTADEAAQCAIWNARAVLLLKFLFGDDPTVARYLVASPVRWIAVLREPEQRARLLEVSPVTLGGDSPGRARLVGGKSFTSRSGPAEWVRHDGHDGDHAVGQATNRGTLVFNAGLGEGLVHTATWLLCGTLHSSYARLAATQKGEREERSSDPDESLRSLRAAIATGEDWPLVQVPRERSDNFRTAVRLKSWSFMTWLLARHPDRWVRLLVELGHQPRLPEEVAAVFEKVLERSVGEVETEWREWARAGSRIGKASGLPQ